MLQAMQTAAEIPPSPTFAGLLAALASPVPKSASAWPAEASEDGLEDDFATLSYERALRAHARYRPSSLSDESLTQAADPVPPAPASAPENLSIAVTPNNLKCVSVTIRVSQAEAAQLRKRAAEAGLTVSAYLRSCTFEAESLRAMVKDTLAQLRSKGPAAETRSRGSWLNWLARLLSVGYGGQRASQP